VRWATRAGIHIDRAACAWLIRRHVDERAEFTFVTDPADILRITGPVFDGIYEYCKRAILLGREPA
jgi:hypothetical protein